MVECQIEITLIKVSFSFSLSSSVVCENAVLFGVGHIMEFGKIKMPHKGEALEVDIEMINLISIIQLEKVAPYD